MNVRMPPRLFDAVYKAASKRQQNMPEFVRDTLRARLHHDLPPPKREA
jgi:hypothetical protein